MGAESAPTITIWGRKAPPHIINKGFKGKVPCYADGYAYYTISNNMGYEGDLEIAMVPESFRVDVLKESLDANKVLVENVNVETANFALLFEFDGDVKKIRHCLYKCAAYKGYKEVATQDDFDKF